MKKKKFNPNDFKGVCQSQLDGTLEFNNVGNSSINIDTSGTSTMTVTSLTQYGDQQLIDHFIFDDRIEFVYKAEPICWINYNKPPVKIWKDVYKCVDGKLQKSETIIGEYIPESHTMESYEFND